MHKKKKEEGGGILLFKQLNLLTVGESMGTTKDIQEDHCTSGQALEVLGTQTAPLDRLFKVGH